MPLFLNPSCLVYMHGSLVVLVAGVLALFRLRQPVI
jgi:hypothetical protein